MKNLSESTKGNNANTLLATGLCLYDVRFRVIRQEDYYTPIMYLPIERIRIEYKVGITDGYILCVPVGKELDINPDCIRIEEFQPCC